MEDSSGAFDRTILINAAHARSKVDCIRDTPFDQTIYLDCDTIVRHDLSDMFNVLERFDIGLARVVLWHRKTHSKHHAVEVPQIFSEPNTGVIVYRSDTPRMRAFLEDWHRRFYEFGNSNDQITMREALWESDVRYYVLPEQFNKRVIEGSEVIYTDRPKARIWHLPILRPQKNAFKRWLANRIR